ncbi:MAG: SIMPL domain-containing protein [Alphaproteobacteria bacterium]|nr:SIMPL domain-containing protein [Alphaproteobacteria bacterium]
MWKSALILALVAGLAAPALAQTAQPRTLSMTGSATAKAAPDMADISAGVTTEAPTAAAALGANSSAMTRVFAALDRAGVARRNVQTSSFSVSPVYATRVPNEPPRLTGYRVSNEVHVILDDMAKVGATLDALVAAGANQMNGLSFAIKDPAPLLAKARADAVADARLRAQQYAAAAGVTLGPIQSVSEGGGEVPRPMYRVMAMAAPQTPIAAGEESVNASVTIVWEIR